MLEFHPGKKSPKDPRFTMFQLHNVNLISVHHVFTITTEMMKALQGQLTENTKMHMVPLTACDISPCGQFEFYLLRL